MLYYETNVTSYVNFTSIRKKGLLTSEAWHSAVHGITKSQTWLNDWPELISLNSLI